MPELIPYTKTSNSTWPNKTAIRFHKKLINKHWKNQNGTNAEPLPGFTLQNRSNSQALDISWDMHTVFALQLFLCNAYLKVLHEKARRERTYQIPGIRILFFCATHI